MNTIEKNAAGRKIVVVGATSGIGLAVAEKLAAAGNTLGLAGRNLATAKTLAERYPERVFLELIDISSEYAPESLSRLIGQMGGMDVYFHVAGVGYSNPELEAAPDGATVEVNVAGFTRMIDAAFRYFTASGGGHIAAITSVAGTKGVGPMAAYCASKSYQRIYLEAVSQLARARRLKISVSDIRPGQHAARRGGCAASHDDAGRLCRAPHSLRNVASRGACGRLAVAVPCRVVAPCAAMAMGQDESVGFRWRRFKKHVRKIRFQKTVKFRPSPPNHKIFTNFAPG